MELTYKIQNKCSINYGIILISFLFKMKGLPVWLVVLPTCAWEVSPSFI
jgi:hypothetical protein